ncbi:tetratricopeptide repeat-containing sensor histidine kinase [Marinoscillum pacificum]|uniref:tetratricopeptide repeat-containing sensor histidine kinase n=1 Tax=Marinoscillum pacificum TaxID=392723 RepID=UPI00215805FF|nr:histidine kinase [Marinoscillum pacificum]
MKLYFRLILVIFLGVSSQIEAQKLQSLYEKSHGLVYINIDSAHYYVDLLDSLAHQSNDSLYMAEALGVRGMMADILSDYINAQKYYYESLGIHEKINNRLGIAKIQYNLGLMHMKRQNDSLALIILRRGLKEFIELKDTANIANTFITTGYLLNKNHLPDSGLTLLKKAYQLGVKTKDTLRIASASNLIGDSYKELKNFLKAKQQYQRTIELVGPQGSAWNLGYSNLRLAETAMAIEDYSDAIRYAQKALEHYQIISEKTRIKDVYGILAEAYENIGNYKRAYQYHKDFKSLNDSLFNEQKNKQLTTLETQYETTKKDQEIQNLSQQSQIQALQINQRNILLAVVAIAFLVIVLAGFIFYQRRKHKHQQAVSNIEQRALRLQMNPHFIFNALASIQNYILQSDTKESVKYLSKFGKLMRQILEHSREEFISIQEEVDMLTNYLEIQQLRFKNSFHFQIDVDTSIATEEIRIPPLFAQPLVENAIEHGLAGIANGFINITFKKAENSIQLTVQDNGHGLNSEHHTITEHKSLATSITKERLAILSQQFKSQFSFDLKNSTEEKGTIASLNIPSIQ